MGLEAHVDAVIEQDDRELRGLYYWSDGLTVLDKDPATAKRIMQVLDNSGEFGLTWFDLDTGKISFDEFKGR